MSQGEPADEGHDGNGTWNPSDMPPPEEPGGGGTIRPSKPPAGKSNSQNQASSRWTLPSGRTHTTRPTVYDVRIS
jgi:hypothetical protein